jgi:hypothetical protein
MIKWFVYIVLILILMPCLSSAKNVSHYHNAPKGHPGDPTLLKFISSDTTINKTAKQKQQELDEKKKIKEVAKARRLPKPEKVDESGNSSSPEKMKPKRQRRPAGLERPPEIPRRNGN